jgi:hypothetical protein
MQKVLREYIPTPSLAVLMFIGIVDLISTAVLHAKGLIVELNPVMRPIIEHSEWLFAIVKGATLVVAYLTMLQYARHNVEFVRRASRVGILLYVGIWTIWFTSASFGI